MNTKDYTDDLIPLIEGLCGTSFATIEMPRIAALVNRRAKRAYHASFYWPRFLTVGEERAVTDTNLIAYTETDLDSIDTFLRIHRTQPYVESSSQDFDYTVTVDGARLLIGGLDLSSAYVTYRSQLDTTYGDGTNGTSLDVPEEWFEYMAHGVYSDFLRSEGQQEKSALAEQEARELLDDELFKIQKFGSYNLIGMRMRTNANEQIRTNFIQR